MADPRLTKLSTGDYDQVFAVTQHMVNQCLENLYLKLERDGRSGRWAKPNLDTIYMDDRNYITNMVLGRPVVIFTPSVGSRVLCQYRMHLKAGNIVVFKFRPEDKKANPPVKMASWKIQLTIKDWYITFPCNLNTINLDKNSPDQKDVMDRMEFKFATGPDGKLERPINHSIYELMLDLGAMSSTNASWEISPWHQDDQIVNALTGMPEGRPGGWELNKARTWQDLDSAVTSRLVVMLQEQKDAVTGWGMTSLGYGVLAPATSSKETFAVKHVRYQAYPWKDPAKPELTQPGIKGNARFNTLLYLETTEGAAKIPETFLDENVIGNWTNGRDPKIDDPSLFGTYMLRKEKILDQFLIPQLHEINRIMQLDIVSTSTISMPSNDAKFSFEFVVKLAPANLEFEKYRFRAPQEVLWGMALDLPTNWHLSLKQFLQPMCTPPDGAIQLMIWKDVEWGPKNSDYKKGELEADAYADTITYSRVLLFPGQNLLRVEGRQWNKIETMIFLGKKYGPAHGGIISEIKWKLDFRLKEVTDGGIMIDTAIEGPEVNFYSRKKWGEDNVLVQPYLNLYTSISKNFEAFGERLRNTLQGAERFRVPADGVYFFKNPVFNHRGDLIANISYNGDTTQRIDSKINRDAMLDRKPTGNTTMVDPGVAKISFITEMKYIF